MRDSDAPTLTRLLAPCGIDEFATRFWERNWLHVSDSSRHGYSDLVDLADLDEIVAYHRHPTVPPFALAENGPIRPQMMTSGVREAAQALRGGQTVLLGSLEERVPAVARLCAGLSRELCHATAGTLVASPANVQGLVAHFDLVDVFALQLSGRKVWRVAQPQRELPLMGDAMMSGELPHDAETIVVEEGDLLYIPRGFPHLAFTQSDAHSVHLSVYVKATTWFDALSKLLQSSARTNVELRRALPVGALRAGPEPELAQTLCARAEEVLVGLDGEATLRTLRQDFVRGLPGLVDMELAQALAAPEITADSLVMRRDGVVCDVREEPGVAAIDFPGASVGGPAAIAPALRHVAAHETFRVGDVSGELSDSSKVVLVRRLVRDGLLKVVQ